MDSQLDGMGRVLRCIREYQRRGGTRRVSSRAIGAATGLSHTQVLRLIAEATTKGWLLPDRSGLAYKRIAVDECLPGRRWIPLTTCSWHNPIKWEVRDGEGESVSAKRFSLRPRGEIWMVAFTAWEPVTTDYPPRLGPGVIAFVRRLRDRSDVRVGDWCLVSLHGEVRSMFRVAGGAFRPAAALEGREPRYELIEAKEVAVIEALHIPCTRRQNKIRLQAAEVVSVLAESPLVENRNGPKSGMVTVNTSKLRRFLRTREMKRRD